jgi:mRNA-degrading endonuclease HigB of HigAB toxin-antitoxin module
VNLVLFFSRLLESAGVEFIDECGGGPDVRLRKDRRNVGDHQYDAPHGRRAGAGSSTLPEVARRHRIYRLPQIQPGKRAQWHRPSDIKAMFGTTVDFVGDNRVVFDISGNKYRLVAHVAFPYKRVLIKFVGTHGEYDRIDAETV